MNNIEERVAQLEKEIEILKERNIRVEADKAWETSYARTGTITLVTYATAAAVLYTVNVERFLLAACVPALGYIFSTVSLPALKRRWLGTRG